MITSAQTIQHLGAKNLQNSGKFIPTINSRASSSSRQLISNLLPFLDEQLDKKTAENIMSTHELMKKDPASLATDIRETIKKADKSMKTLRKNIIQAGAATSQESLDIIKYEKLIDVGSHLLNVIAKSQFDKLTKRN